MFRNKEKTISEIISQGKHIPSSAKDKRHSAVFSADGQPGSPGDAFVASGLAFANKALSIDLKDISARIKSGPDYLNIYPGEHYKLLASIVQSMQPGIVIELGTHLGYSALCMKKYLPSNGVIYTFDIISWDGFEDTILTKNDFDAQLVQYTDDLTKWEDVQKHRAILENADIIFLDAMKDGKQEYQFLENFGRLNFKKECLFIFDDIRLWNMLDIWYNIDRPKLDMTSFGHWSGTGLVKWTN